MHFTRPSAGAAGARRGPVPLSHGSGADSHSLPLRPAGRLREAPGSGRRLPKAGPGFTTSKDDARRDELLMLASTPYRSRFLQMEFYSLSSSASSAPRPQTETCTEGGGPGPPQPLRAPL